MCDLRAKQVEGLLPLFFIGILVFLSVTRSKLSSLPSVCGNPAYAIITQHIGPGVACDGLNAPGGIWYIYRLKLAENLVTHPQNQAL